MRKHIKKLSINDLAWMPTGTPGVMEKIINEDDVSGARTLMLKSLSRPGDQITDRRPQFHPVDEEFFCLSGRFTLEGDPWIERGTYVYYPPNLVHGYAVDVPEGYEIYLRNSGALSTQRVDSPAIDKLHFINGEDQPDESVRIRHAEQVLGESRDETVASITLLRAAEDGGDGTFLVTLPCNTHIASTTDGYDGFLEIFVLNGQVEFRNHAVLTADDYAFFPPEMPIELVGCATTSCCLVSYNGADVLRHFTQIASQSVKLPDL